MSEVRFPEADAEMTIHVKWFIKSVIPREDRRVEEVWQGVGKNPSKGVIPGDLPALAWSQRELRSTSYTSEFLPPTNKGAGLLPSSTSQALATVTDLGIRSLGSLCLD